MIADRYIYAKLIADAGVAALVGTRIYPVIAPQDAVYPLITYSAVYTPAETAKTKMQRMIVALLRLGVGLATRPQNPGTTWRPIWM